MGLAADADVGALAEPELREVPAQLAGAEPVGGPHGADVGGLGEDAGEGELKPAVPETVADHAAVAPELRRHHDPGSRGDLARIDEGAQRERLLDRPRLEDVAHRPRAHVLLGELQRVGGVEGRVVGERHDLAGLGVHDHREPGVGAGILDGLPQHPLGVPLQVEVEGGAEVGPVGRRDDRALPERDPVAPSDGEAFGAVLAGQLGVEGPLEATERLVGADEADHVRGDVPGGVVTHRVLPGLEPFVARLLGLLDDLDGLGGGHPSRDVLEPAALLTQPRQDREVVDVEPVGKELRQLRRLVGRQERVGHHHEAVDRRGQRLAVAVEDVAAPCRQVDLDHALGGRHLGVRVGVHALELHQPRAEDRQHHRDHHEAETQPEQRGAPHAAARAPRSGRTHLTSPPQRRACSLSSFLPRAAPFPAEAPPVSAVASTA